MRYFLMTSCLIITVTSVRSQSRLSVIKKTDTLVYRSEIIRNNLSGQRIIMHRDDGTVYQMEQDGMLCFAPKKAEAAMMPNVFVPRHPFNLNYPMPVVPPKKGLPKQVPKKPKTF